MSKYNARKTTIDGIRFDSEMEGKYYVHLKELKQKGEIKDFELQPSFTLQPKFTKDGVTHHAITYKADFRIIHNDETTEVVDIKGQVLPLFKLKEKMYRYKYDEKLTLLTYVNKYGGWIEVKKLEQIRKENRKKK